MTQCPFCEPAEKEILARDGACYAMWTGEPPEGSAMVLPVAHKETPFDLSAQEWAATRRLLRTVQLEVERLYAPHGWNIGWNVYGIGGQAVPHAHCHVIPRYADEAYAGRGLRWWFKSEANRRAQVSPVQAGD